MNYNFHQIARTEHEARANTLRTPHESDFWMQSQSGNNRRASLLRLRVALTALINLLTR